MIRQLLNLQCEDGHRWFAPKPSVWAGRTCQKKTANERSSCQSVLKAMRPKRRPKTLAKEKR